MNRNLPHGYGGAAEEPPDPGDPFCECGDRYSNHAGPNGLTDDPSALLDALRQIDALMPRYAASAARAQEILDSVLTVCQAKHCTCRKFVERDSIGQP